MKHSNYFAKWCKQEYNCKTIKECKPYINNWIQYRNNLSPHTKKLETAALAKLYGCSTNEFIKTESRKRENITRSRNDVKRDKHFSKTNNADLISFCRSTGLRREELRQLTGDCLIVKNNECFIKVEKGTKGGKKLCVPVIGDTELVKKLMQKAGENKVFEKIHDVADIHSYRAEYGNSIYRKHARKVEEIPYDKINYATNRKYQSGVYACRGDRKGTKFDKKAMLIDSKCLGHNRISVISENYLWIQE